MKFCKINTPGGALKKAPKSVAQPKSVDISEENPCSDTLILDSLAMEPGITAEVNRSLTNGIGFEACKIISEFCVRKAANILHLSDWDLEPARKLFRSISTSLEH